MEFSTTDAMPYPFSFLYMFVPLHHLFTIQIVQSAACMIIDLRKLPQNDNSTESRTCHELNDQTLSSLNPSIRFMEDLISQQQHQSRQHQNDSTSQQPASSICTTLQNVNGPNALSQFPYVYKYFLAHRNGGINCLDWSWNEKYLVTCGNDKTVRLFDVENQKTLKILHGHFNIVFGVRFSPTGNLIASASFDETVKIWSSLTGECLRTLSAHTDPVTSVDFSHDGTILMSSGFDGHIRLWDTSTGQCLKSHVSSQLLKNPPVASARFSPNSQYSLGLLFDGALRLWKCDTTTQVAQTTEVGTGGAIRVYRGAHRVQGKYCANVEWFLPTKDDSSTPERTLIAVPSEPKDDKIYYKTQMRQDESNDKSTNLPSGPAIVLYEVQSKEVVQQATTLDHQGLITSITSKRNVLCSCDVDGTVVIWKWRESEEDKMQE